MRCAADRGVALAFVLAACPQEAPEPGPAPAPALVDLLDYVDVFTGTGGRGFGVGSAFPGPALPFGLARPGPDTHGESSTLWSLHCSGYSHGDPWIAGFSQLRVHGTGVPDYGVLGVMPTVAWDGSETDEVGYRLRKGAETGEPGYYRVELEDSLPITVELTASLRASSIRTTFPPDAPDPTLIIDLAHTIPEVSVSEASLDGVALPLTGEIAFSGAYTGRHGGERVFFVLDSDVAAAVEAFGGGRPGAALRYPAGTTEVTLSIGLSFVDREGAASNLAADVPDRSFEAVRDAAHAAWAEALSGLSVAPTDDDEPTVLASSLYHAYLMPTLWTDADGRYRGFDGAVHDADAFTFFTDLSLWDTYRTAHPLYELLAPDRQRDFALSLLKMAEQGGRIPRWPIGSGYTGGMVGDPGALVVASTLARGLADDVDAASAFAELKQTAERRDDDAGYRERGWVGADLFGGSVAKTLEYAWADAAIADYAAAVGDTATESEYRALSRGWRALWDADSQFLRARNVDGSFIEPFRPESFDDPYVEGSAWHYLFMVPHDLDGLVGLFGSEGALLGKLEAFFQQARDEVDAGNDLFLPSSYYWHGNEPDLHSAALFPLLGEPERGRFWARWAADTQYGIGPDGLSGNDDAGTLGAWYVFVSLGLYPIAGQDAYVVLAPRFPRLSMRVPGGLLAVETDGWSRDGTVREVHWNGVPLASPSLRWPDLRPGGTLRFVYDP